MYILFLPQVGLYVTKFYPESKHFFHLKYEQITLNEMMIMYTCTN
jgi:hypothetical protein